MAQDKVNELLAAMVELVSAWSSLSAQGQIAERIGLDINESDVQLLYAIGSLGEVQPAQLADALQVSRPTTSKGLIRLGMAGLITRRTAPDDRRASIVNLTPDGQAAYLNLVTAGTDMVKQALEAVPEMQAHAESITRFAHALRTANTSHPSNRNT